MGTENTIFYKIRQSGMCKLLENAEYSEPNNDMEGGVHARQYYGCNRNNQPFKDVCCLEKCRFKEMVHGLAKTFNNALKIAKGKKGKKNVTK